MTAPHVDVKTAAQRFRAGAATLLDVREPQELQIAAVPGAMHIPMREIPSRLAEIPRYRPVLVLCHSGGRSAVVAEWLHARGYPAENIAGGIDAWADEVDPEIPRY